MRHGGMKNKEEKKLVGVGAELGRDRQGETVQEKKNRSPFFWAIRVSTPKDDVSDDS